MKKQRLDAASVHDMPLNKQNVIACIKELGSFESGFEKDYEKIIEYACRGVEAEAAPIGESESTQLIFLAAARAYYAICITQETSDDFTSFTAGDVTIAGMASKSARAKEILDLAKHGAAAYLKDDGFAFVEV